MREIRESSLVIAGPRKPGRPQSETPMTSVSAWVPAAEYDRLVRIAKRQGQSVSSIVRYLLTRRSG